MQALQPFLWLIALPSLTYCQTAAELLAQSIEGVSVHEMRGFYKREHSLVKPFMANMQLPWNILGHTVISTHEIRLTNNERAQMGAMWNTEPVFARDWEVVFSFKVGGNSNNLFGDGMAIWYAQERDVLGPVFGSKDYFHGLGIFLDTYSNHNGPHKHGHPWISAMVSNGDKHYDHDRDGTHTQLGGVDSGCVAQFRNQDHETQILIRYVSDTLSIFTDVDGTGTWKQCMSVDSVILPTGYYFGVSAATGDLFDTHDVTSFKMFQLDIDRVETASDVDRQRVKPHAEYTSAPRDHVNDPPPSRLGAFGKIMLWLIGFVVICGILYFGFFFMQGNNQSNNAKRYY